MSLLKGGSQSFADVDQQILSSAKQVLLQNIEFQEAKYADTEAQKIYSKYKPINAAFNLKHLSSTTPSQTQHKKLQSQKSVEKDELLPVPKVVLFPPEKVQMEWKETRKIGPGFSNLGNTCFLNSVLQVLTYTAPLVNYANSDAHRNNCVSVGFCLLCELRNHLTRVAKHSPQHGSIRPMTIIQKLSYISKNFKFGRQEDAHEFLRYFIEALRKSCLAGKTNLDRLSKETTAINQIFGGFFRSQVICLSCKKESNTYDPMMELNLDIKEANSIMAALKRTIKTEKLDGENRYFCERCRKKMPALKKGNIHKAPKVLTLQLKRFDFQRLYGGKVPKHVAFTETLDLRPFMSNSSESHAYYKLYAVLVHSGISCNSGHYYCYVKASNGLWYEMNDSRVSQVGVGTVLRAQAYLLFYSIVQKPPQKAVFQERQNDLKLNQSTSPSVAKPTQNKPGVKDIGISIIRQEPKIVPLVKDRDKVKFTFQRNEDKKPSPVVKKQVPTTPNEKKKPQEFKSPSLEAIMKDYDSSSSEDNQPRAGKEVKRGEKSKETIESKDTTKEERKEKESKETPTKFRTTQPKDHIVQSSETSDSILSPPKSTNVDLLHQKRRIKTSVSSPQSASKFGRWFPIKNLNHNFTPRALYCRSLSDSAAFGKGKKATMSFSESPAESAETEKEKQGQKSKPWMVEEKKIPEVVFGPMTPPPSQITKERERTTSVTSENGHIASKTGEWDVQDKDLPGTPMPPHIPERQFAGWSVEQNKPSTFRMNSTGHDSWDYNSGRDTLSFRKDKESSIKKRKKLKDGKTYERIVSENDDNSKSHKKHKKRRRESERKSDNGDEDDECSPKKRKKCEGSERKEKRKKKKEKKKKKKKSKKSSDSDNEPSSSEYRPKSKRSLDSELSPEAKTPTCGFGDRKNKKKAKKSKKHRKSESYVKSEDADGFSSAKGTPKSVKIDVAEEETSKTTPKNPPRRVPLTFLGPLTKSSQKKSEDSRNSNSHGSFIETPEDEKKSKKKKKKKSKSTEVFADEEKRPILNDSPSEKESVKKDVPVKQWDEAPKKMTSWNGSNNTSVVDSLLSKKSRVETWDGESSSNIDDVVRSVSKRSRDQWDEEYDEGKKKKVKKSHNHHRSSEKSKQSKHNAFQMIQNQRNQNKAVR